MFNATLAGHHLRADYNNSRGGSRAASRFDINEVGRCQVRYVNNSQTSHLPHSDGGCFHNNIDRLSSLSSQPH